MAIAALAHANMRGILLGGWAGLTAAVLDSSTDDGSRLAEYAAANVLELPVFVPVCRQGLHEVASSQADVFETELLKFVVSCMERTQASISQLTCSLSSPLSA